MPSRLYEEFRGDEDEPLVSNTSTRRLAIATTKNVKRLLQLQSDSHVQARHHDILIGRVAIATKFQNRKTSSAICTQLYHPSSIVHPKLGTGLYARGRGGRGGRRDRGGHDGRGGRGGRG